MFWSVLSYAVIVGLIAVGSFMAAQNYPGEYAQLVPTLQLLLAVLAIGAVATITFYALKRYSLTLYSIPATVFVFAFILISVALPQVEPLKGTKELAQSVTQLLKPTDLIAAYDIGNRPGVIFYNVRPVRLLSSEAEVRYFLKHKQGYLFTQKSNLIKLIGNKKESLPAFCSKGELAVLK
ncbi:hypothetical protein A2311_00550 [candidate division WOR-1 bacterium RIFOXYB2_FULL_48_7]|uniref:Uncharacterized protein n=1 Tax=candidate division WOR-1 bacterium RIFOXYB2_FULL_48_7 TaxID=1802583 RepID=A0A1F4TU63_UNCSA|nr:MAG: hypothetical protein A2311_00550 [candidate division WOR-1 bacterium RIFOXYB2_FULL_48_7]